MKFDNNKKTCLSKIDKSNKKTIDKSIFNLVQIINNLDNYYTTSSCSGRIVLFTGKKGNSGTIFQSHDPVSLKQVKQNIPNNKTVWFRQEPLILHIASRNLQSAEKLIKIGHKNGFKRTGIISLKKNLVEIRSDELINALIKDKDMCLQEQYLERLISYANKNMLLNLEKIKKLEHAFKKKEKK
ncbi:MAG: tRNA(Phe) 7-((3-amino-3-carboxypropyl)-4-demethylwyosine(37)-N(4))-methyltransferase [Candidatus Woesearchaeota archaeon]|nr:tRNA(Phe) 7-((3-amino-3-carboxypropyl)-4-demethylwyosine(37)-N(4))-methyltransferase [Candidatus Woesearchaeota archaeon]